MPISYVPEEWAIAKRPSSGTWLLLGAPKVDDEHCFSVVWPLSAEASAAADQYGPQLAWQQPEFERVVDCIKEIISGINRVGEYKPDPIFNVTEWASMVEGGGDARPQAS